MALFMLFTHPPTHQTLLPKLIDVLFQFIKGFYILKRKRFSPTTLSNYLNMVLQRNNMVPARLALYATYVVLPLKATPLSFLTKLFAPLKSISKALSNGI